jgi:hypothetical protein
MANEMEQAYLAKGTYQNGLRVYRHESHKETFTALQQAPKYQSIQKIFNMTTGKEGTLEKAMGINEALKVVGLSGGKVTLIDFRDGLGLFTPTNSNDSAAEPRNTSLTGISTSSDDSTITVVTVEEVEAPNTPGDISTSKSVSPGQTSIVEGGSTDLSEISTNIPGSPAPAGILSVHAASANRFVAPNPKVSETGSNSNSPSKISKVPDRAGADSQKASHNDKGNVAAVETANSTSKAESTSGKKKKKKKKNGSKRKAGKKGKGDKKIEELSSSPVNQDSDGATVPQKQPSETRPTVPQKQPSETRPTLSTEVHREAHIHPDKNTPIEDGQYILRKLCYY